MNHIIKENVTEKLYKRQIWHKEYTIFY